MYYTMVSVVALVNIYTPRSFLSVFIGLHLSYEGVHGKARQSQYLIRSNVEQVWIPEERPRLRSLRTDVEDHCRASAAPLVPL
jgi:hypothetical protein